MDTFQTELIIQLTRIADALERHPDMLNFTKVRNAALGRAVGTYLANTSEVNK